MVENGEVKENIQVFQPDQDELDEEEMRNQVWEINLQNSLKKLSEIGSEAHLELGKMVQPNIYIAVQNRIQEGRKQMK